MQWERDEPRVNMDAPKQFDVKQVQSLKEALRSLDASCDTCKTHGHWLSRVRSVCIDLPPKKLKSVLAKRGLRCEGCTMREHYLDKLLQSFQ